MPTAPPDTAWASIDWSVDEHDVLIDDRRLHYVDHGDGPVILLIHGLGGCWQWWLPNLPALGERHRVIAVDLPGFGDSAPLPPSAPMSAHADAMIALLDRLGIDQAVVVGHSMGGLVLFDLATRHPGRVTGAVPVCAGGITLGPHRLALIVRGLLALRWIVAQPALARALVTRTRLREAFFRFGTGDARRISAAMAAELVPRLAAPGFVETLRAGAMVANQADPAAVRAPTLLIWGDRDRILPVAAARDLAAKIPGARLEVIAGAGHCVMVEEPEQFNALVATFATECAGSQIGGAR